MRLSIAAAAVVALLAAAPGSVTAQDLPPAAASAEAFRPLAPMIGRTWRGTAVGQAGVTDVMRWDWAVGGHAVRITHSVNDGAYGGETLVFPDRDSGALIFHYFTTGGFHTTGVIRPTADGGLEIDETVHGADSVEQLRSRAKLGADGVYRTRSLTEQDGAWVEFGGFDYVPDAGARVRLPLQAGLESPASAGPLDLTRRIVASSGAAGEDAAGYLKIRNGSPASDALLSVSCACADRVEFHHIRRGPDGNGMVSDPEWEIAGSGALDVRPGSDLHLMLINFDPAHARDGQVALTLTFRDAGPVEAVFAVTSDSRGAWAGFD